MGATNSVVISVAAGARRSWVVEPDSFDRLAMAQRAFTLTEADSVTVLGGWQTLPLQDW